MRYNRGTRQIEAGRGVVPAPHAPMQELLPPNTIATMLRQSPLYRKRRPLSRGGFWGFVSVSCGVGFYDPAPLSFVLAGVPKTGGREVPPPGVQTVEENPSFREERYKRNEKTEKGTLPYLGSGYMLEPDCPSAGRTGEP